MKTRHVIAIVGLLLVVAGGWFAWTSTNNRSTNDGVKIGIIAPMTGWGAYWGEGYVKGVQLAVDELKAQGKNVSVVIEDGGTDAAKSASAAQKLTDIDHVDALAVEFTAPTSAVSPISVQKKIPLLYDALVKKPLDENPYAFKLYFDVTKQCTVAAQYLADHGAKHIGGFLANLDFAPECQTAIEKVAQAKGIQSTMYTFNGDSADFRTLIVKMKNDGVDAIVPVFYEDQAISFFKQRSEQSFMTPVFMGVGVPDGFTQKVRSSVATSSLEGIMTYDQPISHEFKKKLTAVYPSATDEDFLKLAFGYDEVMYLYRNVAACPKSDAVCVTSKLEADTSVGALHSPGFGDDRILDVSPVYYRYLNGQLVEMAI
jgi:branched-chain amino acid transport system substrate-binding protein